LCYFVPTSCPRPRHASEIVVLNRKRLERRAGEPYGVPEAELRRLLG
jgi:hypothetical protein